MFIGQAEEHNVGPYVPWSHQISEQQTYIPQPCQEAEEHKVGPYVSQPGRGT
jgi:hypothetical protein